MNILGINNYFEHPAVAIISDGTLKFAMESERFTRIKHGKSYTPFKTYIPFETIYEALKSCELKLEDIDEIAFSYSSKKHFRFMWGSLFGKRLSSFSDEWLAYKSAANIRRVLSSGYEIPEKYKDIMNPSFFSKIRFVEWDHHISHAASAFFYSGFEKSLVVVADGSGENSCTSVYRGRGNELKKISQK